MALMRLSRLTPTWIGSPNFEGGRRGFRPEAIVVHLAEGSTAAVDSWFRNPDSNVSAHYLVTLGGTVHSYVVEEDTAWHAGRVHAPTWGGLKPKPDDTFVNPNLYTIGIEHEGSATTVWTEEMLTRSAMLIAELHVRWGIALDRAHVIGHSEIFSRKPQCPGPMCDLGRLVAMAHEALGGG